MCCSATNYEPKRGRVVVEHVRPNIFIKPYARNEIAVDFEAAALYERNGVGRVIGDWHTHLSPGLPRRSNVDRDTWLRTSRDLKQVFAGIIFSGEQAWESGYPNGTSWEGDLHIGAWVCDANGHMREMSISREPK